jgi:tol-pal system protein YbgF
MTRFRLIPALLASSTLALAASALSGGAWAQDPSPTPYPDGGGDRAAPRSDEPAKARLDRFERDLRELRQIVLQARATGKPVEVRDAGPDPDVADLRARFDDLDQTLRGLTGQIETLTHDDALLKQHDAVLADRVDKLEKLVTNLTAPPPPPPPADTAGAPPAAQAAAAPPPVDDAKTQYAAARKLMLDGDNAGAAAAFQAFLDRYGDTTSGPIARYWLGQVDYAQSDYVGAAKAFLGAIRGWPRTSWAPDAVVKLSQSLIKLNKTTDACGALSELERRYPTASPTVKAHAAAARASAGCERR